MVCAVKTFAATNRALRDANLSGQLLFQADMSNFISDYYCQLLLDSTN